ncbi:GYDIA family GHMP kinase [Flavobacteriaceae bacterium GSB9]|nr:GYDIA family GHMP kinase [Flavobacteriaceae bacterium GSB9]
MKTFYHHSHGKLLITGEYVVLDGALSLAVPTKFGQSLKVEGTDSKKIIWKSLAENGNVWFEGEFQMKMNAITTSHAPLNDVLKRLIQILNTAKTLNPEFLKTNEGLEITTTLDFPRNWGLGTSSTLINNIAQWAKIDAFQLLERTFGGSGYDIACAQNQGAITYQIKDSSHIAKPVDFNPDFKQQLYFVHLNKKQNSREGIKHYHANKGNATGLIKHINTITEKMIVAETLKDFEPLVEAHEDLIGNITNQTPVKTLFFNDFEGAIKSLGAWGGDFILVTSKTNPTAYFNKKGFATVIPYAEMVL